MSLSQPHGDSESFEFILEEVRDATAHPMDPKLREQLLRRQKELREKMLDERSSISPANLKKLRMAAERLGFTEGDVIREGLKLVIEKYPDKLGDLLEPQLTSDSPKPTNGSPSA